MIQQEKIEKALKDIHLLFAASESVPDDDNLIIVDKKSLYSALETINRCMYEMMDSYEITSESRNRQERKTAEKCEKMISDSTRVAEEIYAASVMYTDDAMKRLYDEMRKTQMEVVRMTEKLADNIDSRLKTVVENREQLREELSSTEQSEKYLRILKAEARAESAGEELPEPEEGRAPIYRPFLSEDRPWQDTPIKIAAPAPHIKVDPAYAQDDDPDISDIDEGTSAPASPNVVVNYDSAYFKMKQAQAKAEAIENGEDPDELDDFVEGVIEKDDNKADAMGNA